MIWLRLAPVLIALTTPLTALAAEQQVTASATYVLGDNDTVAAAADICVARIERQVLASSGVRLQPEKANTSAAGGTAKEPPAGNPASFDQDTLRILYAIGATVKVADVHHAVSAKGDRIMATCRATIAFDPALVRERLKAAAAAPSSNPSALPPADQQARIAALEKEVQDLRTALARRDPSAAAPPVDGSSSGPAAALFGNLRIGMTAPEVIELVGDPPHVLHEHAGAMSIDSWNYGTTWVTMDAGRVQCVSTERNPVCDPGTRIR